MVTRLDVAAATTCYDHNNVHDEDCCLLLPLVLPLLLLLLLLLLLQLAIYSMLLWLHALYSGLASLLTHCPSELCTLPHRYTAPTLYHASRVFDSCKM